MGAMLNLNKNFIDLASMLQYSNDLIMTFLAKISCKSINLDFFLEQDHVSIISVSFSQRCEN